jgi:hypothetical protein
MTEVIVRANETLKKIEDTDKPAKIHFESGIQTCKGALVLTLNSREAANGIRQLENKMAFTEAFLKGSHIRERTFNPVALRIPIVFKPDNSNHLRELEEVNRLSKFTICKAHWIKPIERRRIG